MNTPTSPLLNELNQTMEKLEAKARSCSADVAALRKRKADGDGNADESETNLAMVLAGGDVTFAPDLDEQISTAMQKWKVISDAQDIQQRKISNQRFKVNLNFCITDKKPEFDRLMKKLCASLIEANAIHAEMYEMKRFLVDHRIGLIGGVYDIDPESFLDTPTNRYSEFAHFIREAKRLGYLSTVPKGFV
jgi:hypothetical protein